MELLDTDTPDSTAIAMPVVQFGLLRRRRITSTTNIRRRTSPQRPEPAARPARWFITVLKEALPHRDRRLLT